MALKSFDDATPKEMRDYAANVLNLPGIKPNMNKGTVLKLMAEAGIDGDSIEVLDIDPKTAETITPEMAMKVVSPEATQQVYVNPDIRPDGMRWMQTVIVPLNPNNPKQPDLFVGVNGVNYLIQRGQKAVVPMSVVEVMKNAVEFNYQPLDADTDLRQIDGLGEAISIPQVHFSTEGPPYLAHDPHFRPSDKSQAA